MTTSTLTKSVSYNAPDPGTPDTVILRYYTEIVSVPYYRLEPVLSRSEADVILYPDINKPHLGGGLHNWYKRVIFRRIDTPTTAVDRVVIPGRPRGTATIAPPAWDSCAWSIEAMADPVEVAFHVGHDVISGARVGIACRSVSPATSDADIAHWFKIEDGTAYAITSPQHGIPRAPFAYEEIIPYMDVSPGDKLRIELIDGRVNYFVRDIRMATHPSYVAKSPVRLAAALYSNTDAIVNPSVKALRASGAGAARIRVVAQGGVSNAGRTFFRLLAVGGHSDAGATIRVFASGTDASPGHGSALLRSPAAAGFGYTGTVLSGSARILHGVVALGGDYAHSSGSAKLVLLTIAKTDELTHEVNAFVKADVQWLEATAPFNNGGLHSSALCDTKFSGAVSPGVPAEIQGVLSTSHTASLRVSEVLAASCMLADKATGTTVLDAAIVVSAGGGAPIVGVMFVTSSIAFSGAGSASLSADRVTNAQHTASARPEAGMAPQQILVTALDALGHIGSEIGTPGRNTSVWSVNAETGASASYENYPFNSFATIGGRNFAAAADGIYELVGNDDAGSPISSHINLGQRSFGTSKLKSLPYAYLGVASDGVMLVRVTADGESYTYKARDSSAGMQTQRVDFGRGLRANYFTLELMNEGGADFSLDTIELAATPLNRRI